MDGERTTDKRVKFDFEVSFSNGGGLQGQGFRLDIEREDTSDEISQMRSWRATSWRTCGC